MAVTITFGLGVATILVLIVVPALIAFLDDLETFASKAIAQIRE